MTDDSALTLQAAVVATLLADAGVVALVGQRIYDEPPEPVTYPYISLGVFDVVPMDMGCGVDDEINFQVDGWTQESGRVQATRLAAAMRNALDDVTIEMNSYRIADIVFDLSRVLDDPDGETKHAVVQCTARVQRL